MIHARSAIRLAGLAIAFVGFARASLAADEQSTRSIEFFEKKIRPILREHCTKCHGDDARKVKGGLRLDSREALLHGGDSGPAVVPGKPENSRLIEAISYKNVDLQMPPKGKLPEAAIADLATWVRDGVVWPTDRSNTVTSISEFNLARRKADHWAWRPIQRPGIPEVKTSHWLKDPVDAFILRKLEDNALAPAPSADRRTLIRRVTFALTGLPPTPEEIESFLRDSSPDAFAKVVDRLLASPAYGERWGRHWLDLVRYADSKGHEFDYSTPNAWQYRDYVIRALNADVPYNQFALEQVAGDCLSNPRRHPVEGFNESIIGTGFWLLGEEVHSPVDIRQDLADRLDNRIDVLTKTFLGLTVSCARCHDHKFDAISAKDYYALFGILEGGSPRLVRFDSLDESRRLAQEVARCRQRNRAVILKALTTDAASAIDHSAKYLLAAREANASKDDKSKGSSWFVDPERSRLLQIADKRGLDASILAEWVSAIASAARNADDPLHTWAKLAADRSLDTPHRLTAFLHDETERLRRREATPPPGSDQIVIDYANVKPSTWLADEGAYGPAPDQPGDVTVRGATTTDVTFCEEAAATYNRAMDGLSLAAGAETEPGALAGKMRPGRTIRTPPFTIAWGKLFYRVRGSGTAYVAVEAHEMIAGPLHGQIVQHFKGGDEFRWVAHDLTPYKGLRARVEFTPAEGADLAIAKVIQADRAPEAHPPASARLIEMLSNPRVTSPETLAAEYEKLFKAAISPDIHSPANALEQARIANWLLRHPGLLSNHSVETAIASAFGELKVVSAGMRKESRLALALMDARGADEHVFVRGSYKASGEAVTARFLEAIAGAQPLATGEGSGRLELARQMTDPELNPFIARVIVNRIWHHLFGRGIVGSTDNFGVLGERPTHPELLDYLADDFVRHGWSMKSLIRTLVLSNTYQMDSHGDENAEAADPQNLLLHRMRLHRLEGEAIRDSVLAVSGRLNPKAFGPPVPVHLTPFLEGRGRPASGPVDGDGRRSIYLAVRRNFLSPFLLAFDTPIPFSTVGRRTVSNVPAQALILMNDPFVHEQARNWAKRVLAEPGSPSQRIERMYLQAFGRPPSDGERAQCLRFLTKQTGPSDEGWTSLAHSLFNAKEFIFVR
jgi:hypothetical protein